MTGLAQNMQCRLVLESTSRTVAWKNSVSDNVHLVCRSHCLAWSLKEALRGAMTRALVYLLMICSVFVLTLVFYIRSLSSVSCISERQ